MAKTTHQSPETYHGILNLAKPAEWTSHDVVGWVRRTLQQRSVGHAGTLDPLATGVLLVCVGQATRVVEYLTASEKVYRAAARLGQATDTYDRTGQVTAIGQVPSDLTGTALAQVLSAFIGDIQQVPPAYSAIKQAGVAAYRKARRGETVELAPRPVSIHDIQILDWDPPDLTLEVTCGPGTYIRSLVHDLGQTIGCGAHLTALVRLRSGGFKLEDALTLDDLAAAATSGHAARCIQPLQAALTGLPAIPIDEADAKRLAYGQPILCSEPAPPIGATGYAVLPDGQVVAILMCRNGEWWPHKVFPPVARPDADTLPV